MNGFRTAVASTSRDGINSVVVHAEFAWEAVYDGDVTYASADGTGIYRRKPTARTVIISPLTLISPATGGTDARSANYDIYEPRFNTGLTKVFSP